MCVCALARVASRTQHAKRMRRIILSSVASLAPSHFSTVSHKRHDFRKNVIGHKICVFWFSLQLVSKPFLILKRIHRDVVINAKTCSCKVPLFLLDINETWTFSTYFRKDPNIKLHRNLSDGSSMRTDERTDITRRTVAFRSFGNAPKNVYLSWLDVELACSVHSFIYICIPYTRFTVELNGVVCSIY